MDKKKFIILKGANPTGEEPYVPVTQPVVQTAQVNLGLASQGASTVVNNQKQFINTEDFDDLTNGELLQSFSDWESWTTVVSNDSVRVENATGSAGNCYEAATQFAGSGAHWLGGSTFSSGDMDLYFRVQANGMDYGAGVWVCDGTANNSIRCQTIPTGTYRGHEFVVVTGGSAEVNLSFGTPDSSTWYWWRVKCNWEAGTAQCKVWTGDIGDEPGAWTQDESGVTLPTGVSLHVIFSDTTTVANGKLDDITETYTVAAS